MTIEQLWRQSSTRSEHTAFQFKHTAEDEIHAIALQVQNVLCFADDAFLVFAVYLYRHTISLILIEDVISGHGEHILDKNSFSVTKNFAKIYGVTLTAFCNFVIADALKFCDFG